MKVGTEECDDGNLLSGDGCFACLVETGWTCDQQEPSTCLTICGDGLTKGDEECDDGNQNEEDACSSECKKLEYKEFALL